MKYHRKIENFLAHGAWFINVDFAQQAHSKYLSDVAMASDGVHLNYHINRENSRTRFITPENTFISPDDDIRYDSIRNGSASPGSIALIRYSGVMFPESQGSSYGAQDIADALRAAYANPNIDAVLMEVRSGGGYGSAGRIIDNAVKDRNKPVIAYGHMMCSAMYMAMMNTDEVIGSGEDAEFGSIGVYYSIDMKALKKDAKHTVKVYSKKSPDKNKEVSEMLAGNFTGLEKMATFLDEEFMASVEAARPINQEMKKETLAGGVFFARDAKKRGLIDGIGTFNYALARTRTIAKKHKIKMLQSS